MLDELNTKNKAVGLKQSVRAVESGNVLKAFIAKDADSKVTKPFEEMCQKSQIEIEYTDAMIDLGKACGIEVGAAVAVLLKAGTIS